MIIRFKTSFLVGLVMLILLALGGCTKSTPDTANGQNQTASKHSYTIINLGPAFEKFWAAAKDKPFAEQVKIWDRVIEAPHQDFYDIIVWEKNIRPNWPEMKSRILKYIFAEYPKIYAPMMETFAQFDEIVKSNIARYAKFFPDAHFTQTLYAAPAPRFNGQANEDGTILGFGIDMCIILHNNLEVLFSHELFHLYHSVAAKMDKNTYKNDTKLTYQLWYEGLATYASHQMNPEASMDQIYSSTELAKLPPEEVTWAAKEFLKEANEKANDPQKPEIFGKWFMNTDKYRLRPGFPARAGYWFGYQVAKMVNKNYSLNEMAHWDKDRVHQEVIKAVTALAQGNK